MKLSIFTTIKHPQKRGDLYFPALWCYCSLADEIVIVDGNTYIQEDKDRIQDYLDKWEMYNLKFVPHGWRKEFKWPFIGQQFQRGYEAATGDWVIHADLDFIFHEKDFEAIRQACLEHNESPALSFWKYQFIQPDRYNLKSRLVIAVNKGKFGDRIRFDSGGDLCQPSLDGQELKPDNVPESRIAFYNYEKILKTKKQAMDDCGRMERAYYRHFGKYQFSESDGSDEKAYQGWLNMAIGRYHKPQEQIKLSDHPIYMQETIKNLKPENFGYNGHNNLQENTYV